MLLVYIYGRNATKILDFIDKNQLEICFSKTTSRPRALLYNKELFATIRASDFFLVPHVPMGLLLHKVLPFPKRRVVVVNEMLEDILEGHTVFAKHIILADETLKPFEEVLVVDENDKLISLGKTLLDYETMITATYGAAVQIREKIRLGEIS
ncbi:MAG: PUA domain-containing protein [Ignisphaera sp.]|uniref:PUA domain-containing protein n=1 Tax=Ignisphaera aggregans TaxID=334771 RepID=A0A7C4NQP9_9CREN